jgi:dTDP-4-amino-4,6-dideoxygalactose transaminase
MKAEDRMAEAEPVSTDERQAVDGGAPVRDRPFGPRWAFDDAERRQLMEVIDRAPSEWRSGFKVRELTGLLSEAYGVPHAVAVNSGTAALHAAIGALDFDPADEIITTPVTDVGTVIGCLQQNLIPVFVDWDPVAFNMDPADIERKITERTRAILVVHIFGNPCDMDAIMAIARRRGLAVIEDCAQAHLALYDGRLVGTFGDIACFSTGMKTLTTGQGGFLLTANGDLAARIRGFVGKGSEWDGEKWLPYARLGAFHPMTDVQAAIGVAQLGKLEVGTKAREMTAEILDEAFAALEGFTLPIRRPRDRPTHYVYPYYLDPEAVGGTLSDFTAALRAEGIQDAFGPYLKGRPLYRSPMFTEARTFGTSGYPFRDETGLMRIDYRAIVLPVIEKTLPNLGIMHMRNTMTEADAGDIARAIRKVAKAFARRRTGTTAGSVPAPPFGATATNEAQSGRTQILVPEAPGSEPLDRQTPSSRLLGTPFLSLTELGAVGDDRLESAAHNDAAFARLVLLLGDRGGQVALPAGRYHIKKPITYYRLRNVHLIGEGGNHVNTGSQIIYSGAEPAGCLDLVTAVHCRFSGIEFMVQSPAAHQVVLMRAAEGGPSAISGLSNTFENCTFRAGNIAYTDFCGVRVRDNALIAFRQCWFKSGEKAVVIGAPMNRPARTISNGQCNNVSFEHCLFFGDVLGVRASVVALSRCQFGLKDSGGGACVDMAFGDRPEVRNVSIMDCFAMAARDPVGTFFRQGSGGCGFTMMNNRVRFYECAVDLDGLGAAFIAGNLFGQTGSKGMDIRVGALAENVVCQANDHRETASAGNRPIVGRPQLRRKLVTWLKPLLRPAINRARRLARRALSRG